eukprot:CAMPEP_0202346102 /NCGR_PEP_ID=MMETSP1126-20121109/5039_1 /ASSEMBLY_ACC=CAM_ASM_000457 /TAXON_ID=3047 /ORGANISM="Dunaliella tertiolecta, Strain CCMP1320" /LENGTH=358 /DNA_ID=CAMNT_0048937467 /DNA_START=1604 /DNA_END=2677 /DNA_ORIENTATION=-
MAHCRTTPWCYPLSAREAWQPHKAVSEAKRMLYSHLDCVALTFVMLLRRTFLSCMLVLDALDNVDLLLASRTSSGARLEGLGAALNACGHGTGKFSMMSPVSEALCGIAATGITVLETLLLLLLLPPPTTEPSPLFFSEALLAMETWLSDALLEAMGDAPQMGCRGGSAVVGPVLGGSGARTTKLREPVPPSLSITGAEALPKAAVKLLLGRIFVGPRGRSRLPFLGSTGGWATIGTGGSALLLGKGASHPKEARFEGKALLAGEELVGVSVPEGPSVMGVPVIVVAVAAWGGDELRMRLYGLAPAEKPDDTSAMKSLLRYLVSSPSSLLSPGFSGSGNSSSSRFLRDVILSSSAETR